MSNYKFIKYIQDKLDNCIEILKAENTPCYEQNKAFVKGYLLAELLDAYYECDDFTKEFDSEVR